MSVAPAKAATVPPTLAWETSFVISNFSILILTMQIVKYKWLEKAMYIHLLKYFEIIEDQYRAKNESLKAKVSSERNKSSCVF